MDLGLRIHSPHFYSLGPGGDELPLADYGRSHHTDTPTE